MGLWTFITIVAVSGMALQAYQARLKHLRQAKGANSRARDADIDDLLDRVATLESIVTDRKSHLKDEIDQL